MTPKKKIITRYRTADGRACRSDTPGAVKHRERSDKYYARIKQPNGSIKPVPLCTDLAKSKTMLAKLQADAAMKRHGLADPFEEHARRPLAEHLADFRNDLKGRGTARGYFVVVHSRLVALCEGCGFQRTGDFSASKAADWLAAERRDKPRPPLPTGQERFTYAEASQLLGIQPRSVTSLVRRHRLTAEGQGRARRLTRATVETLQDRLGAGNSVATSNQYLTHLKSFARWLVRDRRMAASPFEHLDAGNAALDRRHDRRELSADELRRLFVSAQASPRVFRGLDGRDRFHLYALACGTGFRASALASLTPASFDLAGDAPTVTLTARKNKSKRQKVQPVPLDVAELLRVYLTDKPAGRPVWGGTWARDRKAADMLRIDLDAAGIAYSVPGPDGPLFADFHALRHSFLTLASRSGIDLRTLQELAGHSTPVLTARYAHRRLHDLSGAVEKLPSLLPEFRATHETPSMHKKRPQSA